MIGPFWYDFICFFIRDIKSASTNETRNWTSLNTSVCIRYWLEGSLSLAHIVSTLKPLGRPRKWTQMIEKGNLEVIRSFSNLVIPQPFTVYSIEHYTV